MSANGLHGRPERPAMSYHHAASEPGAGYGYPSDQLVIRSTAAKALVIGRPATLVAGAETAGSLA